MGDQLQEDTDVGPLINEEAAKEVEAVVDRGGEGRRQAARRRTSARRRSWSRPS